VAVDIVCGKQIQESSVNATVGHVAVSGAPETDPAAGTKRFYQGKWYYFCSMACRQKFVALPDEYIAKAAASEPAGGRE
jgi:YHS domain-containing protein